LHPTDSNLILGGVRDFTPLVPVANEFWSSLLQIVPNREWGEAEVAISSRNPSTHWMLAWVGGDIQRTTDGGLTGVPADAGIDKAGAAPVAPVRKCPNDEDVFLTGTNPPGLPTARRTRIPPSKHSMRPERFSRLPFHPARAVAAATRTATVGERSM
jgi:hypothetical protein